MAMTYKEMREISLGAARSYLRSMSIDPLTVDADGALSAVDDICKLEDSLTVYVWYRQIESDNQIKLFCREWEKWRKDTQKMHCHLTTVAVECLFCETVEVKQLKFIEGFDFPGPVPFEDFDTGWTGGRYQQPEIVDATCKKCGSEAIF